MVYVLEESWLLLPKKRDEKYEILNEQIIKKSFME